MNAEWRQPIVDDDRRNLASMEPRLNERGMIGEQLGIDSDTVASMEPRLNERGMGVDGAIHDTLYKASMEPRLNERGMRPFLVGPSK